jgi:uncharacterized RDD family membrane protein YckC
VGRFGVCGGQQAKDFEGIGFNCSVSWCGISKRTSMDEFVFVGFWRRVAAMILDGIICIPLIIPGVFTQKWAFFHRNILPEIIFPIVWYSLCTILVSKYGGTPGKLLMRITIVDQNGNYLKWQKIMVRYVPLMAISLLSIFQYMYAFGSIPSSMIMDYSLMEMGRLLKEYSGPFQFLSNVAGVFYFVDVLVLVFNKKKRAIHDFLADSYVIEKQIRV